MNKQESKPIGTFSIIKSIFAAGFGVQSSKNYENDFKHGKAIHFIVAGLVGTVLFLLFVYALVRFALSSAG